ncbi:hypothetical protein N9M16_03485 [Candidatus Dependentiae bacterium]|nr:hypothetical protein [Candidatus Dependentiae bacterium]
MPSCDPPPWSAKPSDDSGAEAAVARFPASRPPLALEGDADPKRPRMSGRCLARDPVQPWESSRESSAAPLLMAPHRSCRFSLGRSRAFLRVSRSG